MIAGKFNPDEALALIRKYYAPWKPSNYTPEMPQEPEQKAEKRATVKYEGDTLPILAISYKAPSFDPSKKDFAALSLLSELAFGETSPIYEKLVLQDQKADFVSADYIPHMADYLFTVYARLKNPGDVTDVEQQLLNTLEQMKQQPVDAKRLADLKSNRKYSYLMSFSTSKSITDGFYRSLPPYLAMVHGVKAVDQLFATYESVTPEDIQKAANEYFQKEKRTVVTLTGAKS